MAEEEDDDFYSASNWAEYEDPDMTVGISDPSTENQVRAIASDEAAVLPSPKDILVSSLPSHPSREVESSSSFVENRKRRSRSSERPSNQRYRKRDDHRSRSRSRSPLRSRSREAPYTDRRQHTRRSRSRSPYQSRDHYRHDPQSGKVGNVGGERGGRSDRQQYRPRLVENNAAPQELKLFQVYKGTISRVQDYGSFIKLDGVRSRDGLAHVSHYPRDMVPQSGDRVYCKVISISESPTGQRVSLSIKFVDQENGSDLDPDNEQALAHERGGGDRGGNRGGDRDSNDLPELYSIHKGKVNKVESFGCFVSMDGYRKQGLCHVSQFAEYKVDDASEFVSVGDQVFVKVISLGEEENVRISLSMKYCSQSDGHDLDVGHANASMDAVRGKSNPSSKAPIIVGDSLDPMMQFMKSKVGIKQDKEGYDFVLEEEDTHRSNGGLGSAQTLAPVGRGRGSTLPAWMTDSQGGGPQASHSSHGRKHEKKSHKEKKSKKSSSKKHKKDKKSKKEKKDKKEKKSKKSKKSSGSSDDDSSDSGRFSDGEDGEMSDLEWGAAPTNK